MTTASANKKNGKAPEKKAAAAGEGFYGAAGGDTSASAPNGGDIAVGETYQLSPDDASTVATAQNELVSLTAALGEKTANFKFKQIAYEMEEAKLLQAIEKSQQNRQSVLDTVAKKAGFTIGGKPVYTYNLTAMTITRTA